VHARAAIDLRWILPSHHRHPHSSDRSSHRKPPQRLFWTRRRQLP
jgi:hypothetical protein